MFYPFFKSDLKNDAKVSLALHFRDFLFRGHGKKERRATSNSKELCKII
jgi:hypothetical protein